MAEQTWKLEPEIGEQVFGGGRYGAGLLDALRTAGLSIGPREQVAVGALIADLIANAEEPVALADLGSHLAPLLARSPQERETFFRVFNALAPTWRAGWRGGDGQVPASQVAVPQIAIDEKPIGVRTLIIGALAAAAVAAIAIIARPYFSTTKVSVTPLSPVATELAPSAPVVALEPVQPTQQSEEMVGLTRVRSAAAKYFDAPTLEELGRELAVDSPIGWNAEAYTQRLHELTGLPQRTPLALFGAGLASETSQRLTARVAAALEAIERPGQGASASAIEAYLQANRGQPIVVPKTAQGIAQQLAQGLPADTRLPTTDKPTALAQAASIAGADTPLPLIERALAVSIDPRIHRVWPDAPWLSQTPPPNTAFAPWWALILAAALPLLAGLAWLLYALRHKKAFLRRRRPEFPPLHMDLLAEAATQIKTNAALFQRAAQRLSRRTPRDTDRLDIERTVAASIQHGGLLVKPVFARTRAAPEYLVLIEKRAAGDHDYERLRAMALRLADLVSLDLYSYQTEPSLLEPDRGGRFEPIDRVAAKHPDHRLLVLGSGEGFLDHRARKPVASAEKLMRWDKRALLTPMPLSEWAQEEMILARELEMPIGRATPEGMAALAELLGLEGAEDEDLLKPIGDGRARPLPDILRLRGNEFLYDSPPDTHPIAQVVQDLRNYLDDPGFDWLCALAVYPAIQWDLTLYLGVALAERMGGDAKTTPLYSEDRLAALTQLPWFREAQMPNWLRRALIQQMPKARESEVRFAIHRLLESGQPRRTQAENDQIWFRIGEEPIKEPRSPEELFEDEVLLDFMARGALEDFDYSRAAPQRKSRFQFRWLHAAGLGVAATYAAAAFAIAPKPWEGALITGAWLPLALLAFGAALALAATNVAASYAAARTWIERAAPYGLAFAAMIGGLWALSVLPNLDLRGLGPLVFALGLAASGAGARWLARRFGVYLPDSEKPWLKAAGVAAALAASGLFALIGFTLAETLWQRCGLIAAGLTLFALGVLAARYAPEKLPPPKAKLPLGAKPNRWAGAGRAGLVLAGALPALALAWHFGEAHVRVPPAQAMAQIPAERIMATSPDGRFFATGGADGMVRVFDASRPRRQIVTFAAQGGNVCQSAQNSCDPPAFVPRTNEGPVISLAVREVADGRLILAAATLTGSVKLFDGRGGSLILDTALRSVGLRPLIALGTDGGWAVARQDETGTSVLTTNAGVIAIPDGGPILALAAGEGPRSWALALSDGRLGLASTGTLSFAAPDARLPGRARSITFTGATVRAIGDDGSILEADVTPAGLANARLLPADPRLALGPAVGWRVPPAPDPQVDLAACTTLAQQIQTELAARAPGSRVGRGPRVSQLQARFSQSCPGQSVDALAPPPQTVAEADPKQCAPFAREWAVLAAEKRQDRREEFLRRVPADCLRLRAEISAVQSGSAPVGEVAISTATPAGTIFRDRAEGLATSAIPEMVVIPAGSFLMGSPESEVGRGSDEGPQRRVTIAQPFAVGRFEVTFDEYDACVAAKGCAQRPGDQGWGRGRRPVIDVSWEEAQAYARWLSQKTGQRYRLLSEAEWEYAARAGTTTRWSFGDDESQLGAHAWFTSNSGSRTQPVGGKAANRFGLHDVHGNVWELVEDCYVESYSGLATNGSANTTQGCSDRVFRGGSWSSNPANLRSAIRSRYTPSLRYDDVGFRVARTL